MEVRAMALREGSTNANVSMVSAISRQPMIAAILIIVATIVGYNNTNEMMLLNGKRFSIVVRIATYDIVSSCRGVS